MLLREVEANVSYETKGLQETQQHKERLEDSETYSNEIILKTTPPMLIYTMLSSNHPVVSMDDLPSYKGRKSSGLFSTLRLRRLLGEML